jgi:sec-independent protein translocase protein TatA
MGQIGIWQIVIVAVVVVMLFGRGKISELMGDVARGINSFKRGLKDDEIETAKTIDQKSSETVSQTKDRSRTTS